MKNFEKCEIFIATMSAYFFIFALETKEIFSSQKDSIGRIIDLLESTILNESAIFVTGAGRSGCVAKSFGLRSKQLGTDVYSVPNGIARSFILGDVLIAISCSGNTPMVKTQIEQAKKTEGVKIIGITSEPDSFLAMASDIVIYLPQKPKEKDLSLLSLSSGNGLCVFPLNSFFENLSMIVLDSLIPELMYFLDIGEDEMAKKHPFY